MNIITAKLTVLFEDPFWIGVFEIEHKSKLTVCKTTFGAEPSDSQIFEFINKSYNKLVFSPPLDTNKASKKHINPKRMQREIHNATIVSQVGTKAQNAIKLWQEQYKSEHKTNIKKLRDEQKERLFKIHIEKKKQKHKGH